MSSEPRTSESIEAYPTILRGREGRMNGQIIRYLALKGPSLIYSVAQDLASRSETKVHYPTVNRRMHELVRRQYLEKAGTRMTKAGVPADLYATRLRGDFAALAGIPNSSGKYTSELSPKETSQMIEIASRRKGSPFLLFKLIIDEGATGIDLVNKDLVPELVSSVRNGFLNIDALDEAIICSAFASLVARKIASLVDLQGRNQSSKSAERHKAHVKILMRSLERVIDSPTHPVMVDKIWQEESASDPNLLPTLKPLVTSVSRQWTSELKVFLKLYSAMSL